MGAGYAIVSRIAESARREMLYNPQLCDVASESERYMSTTRASKAVRPQRSPRPLCNERSDVAQLVDMRIDCG